MIRGESTDHGVVLVGALPAGSSAYVDLDWLPPSSQPIPSIRVAPDGTLAWCDGPSVPAPSHMDPDTAAAFVLSVVAREAAAAAQGLRPSSVEVTGRGLIARLVRILVGGGADDVTAERPEVIIETTGDPELIVGATQRIVDLGTVVLVGEILGRRAEMNLYPDVYARGLTLIGVAPPLQHGEFLGGAVDALVQSCLESLVPVSSGVLVPTGAAWYRVSG